MESSGPRKPRVELPFAGSCRGKQAKMHPLQTQREADRLLHSACSAQGSSRSKNLANFRHLSQPFQGRYSAFTTEELETSIDKLINCYH